MLSLSHPYQEVGIDDRSGRRSKARLCKSLLETIDPPGHGMGTRGGLPPAGAGPDRRRTGFLRSQPFPGRAAQAAPAVGSRAGGGRARGGLLPGRARGLVGRAGRRRSAPPAGARGRDARRSACAPDRPTAPPGSSSLRDRSSSRRPRSSASNSPPGSTRRSSSAWSTRGAGRSPASASAPSPPAPAPAPSRGSAAAKPPAPRRAVSAAPRCRAAPSWPTVLALLALGLAGAAGTFLLARAGKRRPALAAGAATVVAAAGVGLWMWAAPLPRAAARRGKSARAGRGRRASCASPRSLRCARPSPTAATARRSSGGWPRPAADPRAARDPGALARPVPPAGVEPDGAAAV